jgi:hypothetical protein
MRREAIKRLIQPMPTTLSAKGPYLHKAVLDLARRPSGSIRLVTTNFDNRFELAGLNLADLQEAPRLAPPYPRNWRLATYLHGRISDHDRDGDNLVLTSSDFGRAYLKDGWAARFIVELCREFTILFVGYSVTDPVMPYLFDAIASDIGPGRQFRQAFALAPYYGTQDSREEQIESWQARNVELIPFDVGTAAVGNYEPLYATLTKWAEHHTGGLETRVSETIRTASVPFVEGEEAIARNVAWALSQEDGSVARGFADANPPPDISWLKPLSLEVVPSHSDGALKITVLRCPTPPPQKGSNDTTPGYHGAALAGEHPIQCRLPLAPVTFHLGRWLAKHLEQDTLVRWVIEHGGRVHPEFADQIKRRLDRKPSITAPYQHFWTLVTEGAFNRPERSLERYLVPPPTFNAGTLSALERRRLLLAASPYLSPSRSFTSTKKGTPSGEAESLGELVRRLCP